MKRISKINKPKIYYKSFATGGSLRREIDCDKECPDLDSPICSFPNRNCYALEIVAGKALKADPSSRIDPVRLDSGKNPVLSIIGTLSKRRFRENLAGFLRRFGSLAWH